MAPVGVVDLAGFVFVGVSVWVAACLVFVAGWNCCKYMSKRHRSSDAVVSQHPSAGNVYDINGQRKA